MSVFNGRFDGRSAIITGGASGLGKSTAQRIIQEGGRVSLWDRDESALEKAKAEIGADHTVVLNITDHAAVARAAEATYAALNSIDILVNSAGITGATEPVIDFPIDSWLTVMDVNLNGLFYCCREVTPFLLKGGYGRIVNVSSVAGKEGNPKASAYSASKAGVLALTKSLGKELATMGVLVNAVTPATFVSPILSQMPESQVDYMRSKIPMGRLGEIPETSAMVCFLASEECSFSTAATFDTSGGRTTF